MKRTSPPWPPLRLFVTLCLVGLTACDPGSPSAPNTAPTVSIVSPDDGTTVTEGTPIGFAGTASDEEDGILSSSIEWRSSRDGALGTGAGVTATLSVGTHTVSASVTDSEGESASASVAVQVLEDGPPTVEITDPEDGSTVSEGTSITFTATASDTEDGDLTGSVAWASDVDGALGTGPSVEAVLSVGTHTVTAAVTDSHGQSAEDEVTVTVEAGGPELYASTLDGPGGVSELYRVEATSDGEDELIGTLRIPDGGSPAITDIARGEEGEWYAVTFNTLYSLDPATGSLEVIGGMGRADVNSLVRAADGTLLAATLSGQLVTIDAATGTATVVGSLGSGLTSDGDLTIGPDGQLWGSFVSPAGSVLATVDRVTGTATIVGETGLTSVWGLAWVKGELFGMTNEGLYSGRLVRFDPATADAEVVRELSFGNSGSANPRR